MAWLTGCNYRKSLDILYTVDGAQTNYQLKLLVGESAGSGTNNVHCVGHVLSSFNDLRFTNLTVTITTLDAARILSPRFSRGR